MNHTEPADTWLKFAACKADPDAMFPGTNDGEIEYAKDFCRQCPVIYRCRQLALETGEEYGVWGGLSEKERRAMKRRAARQINLDEYTGTRPTRQKGGSLEDSWEANTLPDGEHVLWTGPAVIYRPLPQTQVTPNRLSFYLDRERWPEGDCKRTCEVEGCVRPAHLNDQVERAGETGLALRQPKREAAKCGTRGGYRRHRKNGEDACPPCKQANTDADNRLRRTGTTKALV